MYNRSINQTKEMEDKMQIEITSKDVAKAIAQQIEQATGEDCEAYSNVGGSVVIMHNTMIARITPLFSVMDVAPTAGPFRCEITEIPMEASTVSELMEIAHAIDEATSHVLAAAVTAQKH